VGSFERRTGTVVTYIIKAFLETGNGVMRLIFVGIQMFPHNLHKIFNFNYTKIIAESTKVFPIVILFIGGVK
jgi:hypothetical protein